MVHCNRPESSTGKTHLLQIPGTFIRVALAIILHLKFLLYEVADNLIQMNFVSMISDALYSDSDLVVEAMAELVDESIRENTTGRVSNERMTQARYIMEVEEEVFRSITAEDLYRIEVKEMQDVLGELVSAVGLQRFRFSERQAKGTQQLCLTFISNLPYRI